MTSLFERRTTGATLPVDLVSSGTRGVSLLEFMAADAEREEAVLEDAGAASASAEELAARERAGQVRAMVEAARSEAEEAARRELEAFYSERVSAERGQVERVLREFAVERAWYFSEVEGEVVRLALALAAKVLAREVQADPTHLRAVARAALSRVQDGSQAVLRVRPEAVDAWRAALAGEGEGKVEVLEDLALGDGDCVVETSVGRVELGVAVQLGEIERGFRELLKRGGE